MLLDTYVFLLSVCYVICSLMVVFSKNPVHSVLYLILLFIITINFFFILGVEYLAFVFLIIYIGAIAVLFLFIVMMLNIKTIEYNETFLKYLPISSVLMFVLFLELNYVFDANIVENMNINFTGVTNDYISVWENIELTGKLFLIAYVLYTNYAPMLIMASLLLLLAMLGSIMLTLTNIHRAYRDDIYKKVSSDMSKSLRLVKVTKN